MSTSAYWPGSVPRDITFSNFYGPSIHRQPTPSSSAAATAVALPSPRGPMSPSFPLNATAASAASSIHSMQVIQDSTPHPYPPQYPPHQSHNFEAFLHKSNFPDVSSMEKQRFGYNYKLPWQHVEERFGAMSRLHQQKEFETEEDGDKELRDGEGKDCENRTGCEPETNSKLMSHCRILKIKGKKLLLLFCLFVCLFFGLFCLCFGLFCFVLFFFCQSISWPIVTADKCAPIDNNFKISICKSFCIYPSP